jgi:peptidoglycan/xylan/chitin deacetylase (PgdA/CDA1 family)
VQFGQLRRAFCSVLSLMLILTSTSAVWAAGPAADTDARDSARQEAENALLEAAAHIAAVAGAQLYTVQSAASAADRGAGVARAAGQSQAMAVSSRGESAATAVQSGVARVPILMYHHIASAPAGADAIRLDLSVSPVVFTQQMDYLQSHGYQTVSLADLVNRLARGIALPAKPVVLTFDDGYDDNYSQAYPILRRHGFSGEFFLITNAVGNPDYMTWDQAIEMSRHGMSIQAHGRTHADLAVSSAGDATWQIAGSRAIIEEKIGAPVQFYCYPSGRYSAQTIDILRAKGYVAAVTTAYGATHSPSGLFELSRVRMRGADSLEQFVVKLETAP